VEVAAAWSGELAGAERSQGWLENLPSPPLDNTAYAWYCS